jgi:hypothetical protein
MIWLNDDTLAPSVVGPYEDDKVFSDANLLREVCYKVQVCNSAVPEKCDTLKFLLHNKALI